MYNPELHSRKFNLAKSMPSYLPSKMLVAGDRGLVTDRRGVAWYWVYFEIVETNCQRNRICDVKASRICDESKILDWVAGRI